MLMRACLVLVVIALAGAAAGCAARDAANPCISPVSPQPLP